MGVDSQILTAINGMCFITENKPMRKLIASAFVSLDGIMQAPGGRSHRRFDEYLCAGR